MLGFNFKPKQPPTDSNKPVPPPSMSMAERLKAEQQRTTLPASASTKVGKQFANPVSLSGVAGNKTMPPASSSTKVGKQFANPASISGMAGNKTMNTQPAAFSGKYAAPANMTVGEDYSLQTQKLKRIIEEANAERRNIELRPLPRPPQTP